MAFDFDGSSQYWSLSSAILTDEPITMACWFQVDALTAGYTLMSIANTGSANGFWRLHFDGTAANDPLYAQKQNDGGSGALASINTSASTGTWYHGAAVFSSNTSRTAYFNGTAGTENTTSVTDSVPESTAIGARVANTVTNYTNGKIAEAAIWNVVLSAGEIAALAKGFNPWMIRPNSIVAYVPMVREVMDFKGNSWTNNGPATVFPHPRIMRQARRQIRTHPVPAGGATPYWVFARQRTQIIGSGLS